MCLLVQTTWTMKGCSYSVAVATWQVQNPLSSAERVGEGECGGVSVVSVQWCTAPCPSAARQLSRAPGGAGRG